MKLPHMVIMRKTLWLLGQRQLSAHYNYRTPPPTLPFHPSLAHAPPTIGGTLCAGWGPVSCSLLYLCVALCAAKGALAEAALQVSPGMGDGGCGFGRLGW